MKRFIKILVMAVALTCLMQGSGSIGYASGAAAGTSAKAVQIKKTGIDQKMKVKAIRKAKDGQAEIKANKVITIGRGHDIYPLEYRYVTERFYATDTVKTDLVEVNLKKAGHLAAGIDIGSDNPEVGFIFRMYDAKMNPMKTINGFYYGTTFMKVPSRIPVGKYYIKIAIVRKHPANIYTRSEYYIMIGDKGHVQEVGD